jgi:hypothetical protein
VDVIELAIIEDFCGSIKCLLAMEKKAAVICGTAGLLGLLAVILGFVGESTKSQVSIR